MSPNPNPLMDLSPPASAHPNLSVGHVFGRGWAIVRDNLPLAIGGFLAVALLPTLVQLILGDSALIGFVTTLIVAPIVFSYYHILVRLNRGEPADFSNLTDGFQVFGTCIGVYFILAIAIVIGLVFLIIPGLFLAASLFPAYFLVLDERRSIGETLRRAWDLTEGRRLSLLILILVGALIAAAGLLALGVGVLLTAPIAVAGLAVAYDELRGAY